MRDSDVNESDREGKNQIDVMCKNSNDSKGQRIRGGNHIQSRTVREHSAETSKCVSFLSREPIATPKAHVSLCNRHVHSELSSCYYTYKRI